jgi:hypothetical protein
MKKSSQVQSMFSDSYFKRIHVQNILAWQQSTINVWNHMELQKNASLTAPKVRIRNETNTQSGFVLDVDENKPNVLTLQQYDNTGLLEKGIVYDTHFNQPEPALMAVSPLFAIPEQQTEAGLYLRHNPNHLLLLSSMDDVTFEFPCIPTPVKEEYRQVRVSNTTGYCIRISYDGRILVELFQERVSLVWTQKDGRYTWVYIP